MGGTIVFLVKFLITPNNTWEFLNALHEEEQVNRMKIEQYVSGMEPPLNFFYKDQSD